VLWNGKLYDTADDIFHATTDLVELLFVGYWKMQDTTHTQILERCKDGY
jgi:hypothetical protein